jgi:hypothetical protein
MVICWVTDPAIIAAAIALPRRTDHARQSRAPPSRHRHRLHRPGATQQLRTRLEHRRLLLLALAGLRIAIAGALGPPTWAAATKTTTALRAE